PTPTPGAAMPTPTPGPAIPTPTPGPAIPTPIAGGANTTAGNSARTGSPSTATSAETGTSPCQPCLGGSTVPTRCVPSGAGCSATTLGLPLILSFILGPTSSTGTGVPSGSVTYTATSVLPRGTISTRLLPAA